MGQKRPQVPLGVFFALMLLPALRCLEAGSKSDAFLLSLPLFLHIFRRHLLLRSYATQIKVCREISSPFQLDVWRHQFRATRLYTRPWSPLVIAAIGMMLVFLRF